MFFHMEHIRGGTRDNEVGKIELYIYRSMVTFKGSTRYWNYHLETGTDSVPADVRQLRLHYTRLFPDPRFLLFVLQNIACYKNAVECLLQ